VTDPACPSGAELFFKLVDPLIAEIYHNIWVRYGILCNEFLPVLVEFLFRMSSDDTKPIRISKMKSLWVRKGLLET
jgi:hypothetical protein